MVYRIRRAKLVHILPVSGPLRTETFRKCPSLETLQGWVGGYIQIAPGLYQDRDCTIIMDEEGKLKRKNVNNLASLYWHNWYRKYRPEVVFNDFIVGDCVILDGISLS